MQFTDGSSLTQELGINTGGMVECCESRGAGSREEEIGAATGTC